MRQARAAADQPAGRRPGGDEDEPAGDQPGGDVVRRTGKAGGREPDGGGVTGAKPLSPGPAPDLPSTSRAALPSPLHWRWLGRIPYLEALESQRAYRARRAAGEVPDILWLLEHDPVITTGRRVVAGLDPEAIAAAGYALVATERGGLATCHEPGQLVGYLLADIGGMGVKALVAAVEDGLIGWLREEGVEADRRPGYPGVWVGSDKIAALGLNVQAGLTMHGFAVNLDNDLRGFGLISPCGITDGGVTTLQRLLGKSRSPEAVAERVAVRIAAALGREAVPVAGPDDEASPSRAIAPKDA